MNIGDKLKTRAELSELRAGWRAEGRRVGFTSGVFDILHAGHADYLERAKQQCDLLLVGVNSDASVRANKGPARPIVPENERLQLVAALQPVDYAFLFAERNNEQNIAVLEPDFYIKASDYSRDKLRSAALVEAYGGRVLFMPFRAGLSSTSIIERISEQALGTLIETLSEPPRAKRPAVFVDRDGTLIEHVEYLHDPEKLRALPGAMEALKTLREAGFAIVVVTNQPGIGFGYFSKEDFFRVSKELLKAAAAAGALIDKIYYCPHTKAEACLCRKPETAFIARAVQELNVDPARSFMIGDSTADVMFGKKGGLRTVLVSTGLAGSEGLYDVVPDFKAADMAAAAELIVREASFEHE